MKSLCLIFALLLSVCVSAADIALLDSWTAPDGGLPAAFTVSAGTDRMLVVTIGYEVTDVSNIATCKLGSTAGVSLTFIERVLYTDNNVYNHIELWRLMDADLPSADSTLAFTYTGNTPPDIGVGWASYENVHQSSPVSDSDTAFAEAQVISTSVTGVAGGVAVFVALQKSSDQDAVWGDPSEAFDITPGNDFTMTGADSLHPGSGEITGDVTFSGASGRIVIVGVEFAPAEAAEAGDISYVRRIKEGEGK